LLSARKENAPNTFQIQNNVSFLYHSVVGQGTMNKSTLLVMYLAPYCILYTFIIGDSANYDHDNFLAKLTVQSTNVDARCRDLKRFGSIFDFLLQNVGLLSSLLHQSTGSCCSYNRTCTAYCCKLQSTALIISSEVLGSYSVYTAQVQELQLVYYSIILLRCALYNIFTRAPAAAADKQSLIIGL
jgi:hypothetical protein